MSLVGEQLTLLEKPAEEDTRARVVVADPPWKFGDKLPGPGRGAEKYYPTLSPAQIVQAYQLAFLRDVSDNATLLLWRVASMQQEALDVLKLWGFKLKSEIVWLKRSIRGKRHFGMGRQVRMEHEVCLIATRGKGAVVQDKAVRSVLDPDEVTDDLEVFAFSGVFSATASREHSKKPEEFFDVIEQLYAGPYVELFARRVRPGWACLGDEI